MNKRAVVLLSGGLDSSTCLFVAKSEGYDLYALSFAYGQRHVKELDAAHKIANVAGVKEHRVVSLPTPKGSALTSDIDVGKNRNIEEISIEIPSTYVPARNTLFMAYALQFAEEVEADAIFLGVVATDSPAYPDTRPEYIEAWQYLINLATKRTVTGNAIKLETPLLHLYKSEIVEIGMELNVPYSETWSCYSGGEEPCLECDTCLFRSKGFIEAGFRDPAVSEERWNNLLANWKGGK